MSMFSAVEGSGSSRCRSKRIVDDFPLPLRPHIATFSPPWMVMLRSRMARFCGLGGLGDMSLSLDSVSLGGSLEQMYLC